jgi:hypothetical protein
MIEDERESMIPSTINVRLLDYIDRTLKSIYEKIESKCDVWRLELSNLRLELVGLRNEWKLENTNLIQRFESFLKQYENDKAQTVEHFDRVNNLQGRLDKMTTTFQTSEMVDAKIELALAKQTRYTLLALALLAVAGGIIAALLGKL